MLLLDTCGLTAVVRIEPAIMSVLEQSGELRPGQLMVSPISAWEIVMLSRGKPRPETLAFRDDPVGWWRGVLANPFLQLAAFTPEIAFDAYLMPEPFHNDPADRMLVATARALRCPIVTSDRKILAYAALGHVQAKSF